MKLGYHNAEALKNGARKLLGSSNAAAELLGETTHLWAW
jgi:hypothetical protein